MPTDGREGEEEPLAADMEVQYSVKEALSTGTFWGLLLNGLAVFVANGGLASNLSVIMEDAGIDLETMSRAVMCPMAVMSVISITAFYWLAGREVKLSRTLALGQATVGLAALCLLGSLHARHRTLRLGLGTAYGVMFGAGTGMFHSSMKVVFPEYFGRECAGRIMGVSNFVCFLGVGLGPVFFGAVRNATGRYDRALLSVTAAMAVTACVSFLFLKKPGKK